MRFLHTSDWHLGLQFCGISLLDEQRKIADFLVQTVKIQQLDAVIIAGDVFDHAVPTPDAVRLYTEMTRNICGDCGVPLLICAGNHDGAARLSVCAPLLRGAGLYVAGSISDGIEPIILGDTAFFLLPYFNAEEVRWLHPEKDIRGASDAMNVICEELRTKFPENKRNILVSHCFAAGGEIVDSDRAAMLGTAGRIALNVFEGFDYVALGHLHRAQQLYCNDTVLRYSGTPYPYSFSEVGEKSFTIVDTSNMEISTVIVPQSNVVRILRGKYNDILEQAPWDNAKEDYLKIILTDEEKSLWKISTLKQYYPNLLSLDGITPDATQGMSIEELNTITPLDLVKQFCLEIGSFKPDDDLLDLFMQAALKEGEN